MQNTINEILSVARGETARVYLFHPDAPKYKHAQIDIRSAAVQNPLTHLMFSTEIKKDLEGAIEISIETTSLPPGFFEVALLRLQDPTTGLEQEIIIVPARDGMRKVFEVTDSSVHRHSGDEILKEVQQKEHYLEQQFLQAVDVRKSADAPINLYCSIVFVKDVLIGTRIRMNNFEILPTNSGLGTRDSLLFVNDYIKNNTSMGIEFGYDETLRQTSQQSNPVCVFHYPTIAASSTDEARDYCIEKTNLALLALSLLRDAGGSPFDIVIINRQTGESNKYSMSSSYVGNLITGQMAGESASTMEAYMQGLRDDSFNMFLVGLYKEARRDRSPDFQYVRYWQLLETMAENKNYKEDDPLIDYEGNAKYDNGRRLFTRGSVNIVYNLLRESGLGGSDKTWKNVNIWFAFRNAVAHHGSVLSFDKLSRENVKAWAKVGVDEVRQMGHDQFLWELKEDVKMLLMRRLTERGPS